ncbi:hypothetical protein [Nocardia sp. AB354]|uniref:hypothetical protein n=1 Tax=Nocardia sp. AB354 TaxID=3413283 RepID=UPI003C281880
MKWDVVVGPEDALATEILQVRVPGQHWRPQGGGVLVKPDLVDDLQGLWTDHITGLGRRPAGKG